MNPYSREYNSLSFSKQHTKQSINLNIEDYTLKDIFDILEIKYEDSMNATDKLEEINRKADSFIATFTSTNRPELVNFFTKIKEYFINNSITEFDIDELSPATESKNESVLLNHDMNVYDIENIYTSDVSIFHKHRQNFVNQIIRKTISLTINIDSRYRNNRSDTTSNDFSIQLPSNINNVIEMKICDIEFPISYYPIASEYINNYFWVKRIVDEDVDYYYVHIKDGVYSKIRFIELFNDNAKINNINLFMELDEQSDNGMLEGTGKLKILHVNNGGLSLDAFDEEVFEINFDAPPYEGDFNKNLVFHNLIDSKAESYYNTIHTTLIQDKLGWMMGFRNEKILIEDEYTAESIMDISGPKYFYICINDYNGNINNTYYSSSKYEVLKQNIMGRIKIVGPYFSIMKPDSNGFFSNPRYYFGPINLEKISVSIFDDHNRLLNLNNSDLSFTIQVKCIYQSKSDF